MANPPAVLKSFEYLSASKSLDEILKPDFKKTAFFALPDRVQELLLEKLRSEVVRLREVEQKLQKLESRYPRTDLLAPSADRLSQEECEALEDQREAIKQKWSYPDPADPASMSCLHSGATIFTSHDVSCKEGDPNQDLVLNPRFTGVLDSAAYKKLFDHYPKEEHNYTGIEDKISSQLLLYRLTLIFGIPPDSDEGIDGYKSCWSTSLIHSNRKRCLELSDYKAGPHFRLESEEVDDVTAVEDTMELLNHLAALNCPHTYDGVVAGSIA